ncbi:general odorant-binding protein 71 [Toxorhynchites rutilus septentrionalis]|uniref:general odorant-binding protein 71 n=1 Tax=Toxorhynchites rutilus septentrionalis TaxID=329112 RepID=UPI00247A474F|nr:general odorant-binding protein 71 [Toxorhynchites rutilus septentrionalis]
MDDRWMLLSLLLLVILVGLLDNSSALRCRTQDGPSSEEVRKVIRTCMKRVTTETDNETSNENNESSDSSYPDANQSEENGQRDINDARQGNQRGNGRNNGGGDRTNDRNSDKNGENRQNNNRNRNEGERYSERDFGYGGWGNGRSGRYKRQYYNDRSNNGYGNGYQENNRYDRDQRNFQGFNGNSSHNASVGRDRACLMQCFFQELKMTNNEGFPDKHRVIHVVTKDLRDNELRDFYIDSIQECFHMIAVEPIATIGNLRR